MGKIKAFWGTITTVTGIGNRHNKALRDMKDWAETLRGFLIVYDLYASPNFNLLIESNENINKAKFDLIYIIYKGRILITEVKNIKGRAFTPLISEIMMYVENLKEVLTNLPLQDVIISEITLGLRKSFEKLKDALSDIEYK